MDSNQEQIQFCELQTAPGNIYAIDNEYENYTILSLDDNSTGDISYNNRITLHGEDESMKTTINYKLFEQPINTEEDQASLFLDISEAKIIDLSTLPTIDIVPQPLRLFQAPTPRRRGRPPKTSTPILISPLNFQNTPNSIAGNSFRLNSGEDETSSIYLKVPNNSPNDQPLNSSDSFYFPQPYNGSVNHLLDNASGDSQTNHSLSERKRRNRIKNACVELRRLIPCLTEKSDNATVLERTVDFLFHIKQTNGELFL